MKTLTRIAACMFMLYLTMGSIEISAQSTGDNNPFPGKFLGYNGAQNLEFRTNNSTRMQMMQNGFSNINGFNIDRSGFLGLSQNTNFFTGGVASPFSLLHLNGDNNAGAAQQLGYRSWMRYGITFTHNQDLMYIGPCRNDADDVTDAVIAWSDNTQFSQNGPDNLVFMFTTGGATGNDLETGRMTAAGFTGIGTEWSNDAQPKHTLDVIRNDGRPQFRLSYATGPFYNSTPGTYTDFQTSPEGNLHIKPVDNTNLRATTIGFLDNEEPDPLNGTVLDVGPGRTRIRQLPEISPDALIIGYRFEDVNMVDEDNFIGRLEFPDNEEADCFVLNGEGQWIDVCNLAGGDLDWETDGTDVWTGHGMNDFPAGDVTIGDIPGNNARLSVIDVAQSAWRSGQYVEVTGTPGAVGTMRGIHVNTDGSMGNQHVGVDALARSGKLALGGRFTAILDSDQSQWCCGNSLIYANTIDECEATKDIINQKKEYHNPC